MRAVSPRSLECREAGNSAGASSSRASIQAAAAPRCAALSRHTWRTERQGHPAAASPASEAAGVVWACHGVCARAGRHVPVETCMSMEYTNIHADVYIFISFSDPITSRKSPVLLHNITCACTEKSKKGIRVAFSLKYSLCQSGRNQLHTVSEV